MRILIAHNHYQREGGEDGVVQAEAHLLRQNGHDVDLFEEDNKDITGKLVALQTALQCVYSPAAARDMHKCIERFRPDVVHVHNFFPKLSPSIHYACNQAKIPVVQTLHNYRLLCPAATLLRDGMICEDCLGKAFPWPAVQHGCYRNSHTATAAVSNMLFVHRALGTWAHTVTQFIALTEFARQKFIAAGLPASKISVKANFVLDDPGMGAGDGEYALFVGRLSEEKGLDMLLTAWEKLNTKRKLKIVGDGPLAYKLKEALSKNSSIEWLGWRNKQEIYNLMSHATVLVFPSIWYEGFPLVLAEAFATGLPVIASRLGAMAELVTDGKTGRLYAPLQANELTDAIEWAFTHPSALRAMRPYVRSEFEEKYTAETNYALLSGIYRLACSERTKISQRLIYQDAN
jgi:glycosyltransferase involved in cell wall biosynthesis